jgi:hypothetical protein
LDRKVLINKWIEKINSPLLGKRRVAGKPLPVAARVEALVETWCWRCQL